MERNLVHETGINSTERSSSDVTGNQSQAGVVIGVELGVDFIAVGLSDLIGKFLWRKNVPADPAASQENTFRNSALKPAFGVRRL